jgi:hypothetical protein
VRLVLAKSCTNRLKVLASIGEIAIDLLLAQRLNDNRRLQKYTRREIEIFCFPATDAHGQQAVL